MDMHDQVVLELEKLLSDIEAMILASGRSLDEIEADSLSIVRKNLTAEILRKCTDRSVLRRSTD